MKLSNVRTMDVTEDDEDTIADQLRIAAYAQLPLDVQETIVNYEMGQIDKLLQHNYDLHTQPQK